MKSCFDCGLPIHISVPLFDGMPVYCPSCLFELRARIVKDLDEQGHLEAYRRVALPPRGPRPWNAPEPEEECVELLLVDGR